MAQPIDKNTIVVQDWPGLQTNTGPMAGQDAGSAVVLSNFRIIVPGELAARPGIRRVLFDTET